MVILEPLPFSLGNVSNFKVGTVLVQSDKSYSTLSPVVHGDIAPSQTTNTIQSQVLITQTKDLAIWCMEKTLLSVISDGYFDETEEKLILMYIYIQVYCTWKPLILHKQKCNHC